jgi:hypothetical protein
MNKKKIAKIAKYVAEHLDNCSTIKSCNESNIDWCDYDEEISNKCKKLVISLVECDSVNIRVELNSDNIHIRSDDYTKIKSVTRSNYSDDDSLGISIYRNRGFSLSQGYKFNTGYKDTKIYDDVFDIIKVNVSKTHLDTFNIINDNVMSVFNRENNLKTLLE